MKKKEIIEYTLNKYSELKYEKYDQFGYTQIYLYGDEVDVFEMMKEYFNYINNKKIINLDGKIINIKIHTSKENIDKLINNYQEYKAKQQSNLN